MDLEQYLVGSYDLPGGEFTDSRIGTLSFFMKPINRLANETNIVFGSGPGNPYFTIGGDYFGGATNLAIHIPQEPEELYIYESITYRTDSEPPCPGGYSSEYDKIMMDEGWVHVVLRIFAKDDDGGNYYRFSAIRWDNASNVYYRTRTGDLPEVSFFGALSAAHFSFVGAPASGGGQIGTLYRDITFVDGRAVEPDEFATANAETGELTPIVYAGNLGNGGWYLTGPGTVIGNDPVCARPLGENELSDLYVISSTNGHIDFIPYDEPDVGLHCTPQIIPVPCRMVMCPYFGE